jgi:hypothetical protein
MTDEELASVLNRTQFDCLYRVSCTPNVLDRFRSIVQPLMDHKLICISSKQPNRLRRTKRGTKVMHLIEARIEVERLLLNSLGAS